MKWIARLSGILAFLALAGAAQAQNTIPYVSGTSGLTSGHLVTSGSTVGQLTDGGVAGTAAAINTGTSGGTLCLLNANCVFSGSLAETGTSLPTQAGGTLGVAGTASKPTLAASAEGDVFLTSAGGINLIGEGSTYDFSLFNSGGSLACSIATTTTTLNCVGLSLNGSALTSAATTTVGTSGGDLCLLNTACTFSGNTTVSSASFGLSGNISTTAWTTSGVRYKNAAATLTDTSSSGTVAAAYTDLWGASTVAASSTTTYTNYYGDYFKAPVASTNVTFTNSYAIGGDSANFTTISLNGTAMTNTPAFSSIAAGTNTAALVVGASGSLTISSTGTFAASNTALPTQGGGTLGISGTSSKPTLGAAAEGDAFLTSTGGLNLIGEGSTNDFTLFNSGGTAACVIATTTTTLNCTGLQAGGAAVATLSGTSQQFSGGFLITAYSIGVVSSGTTTVNCGSGPLQWFVDGGASTLAAPTSDSNCLVHMINGGGFGTITISGFREGSNTGDAVPTADRSSAAATFTASNASITWTQTAIANDPVYFTGTTAPTGITFNTVYYVSATGLSGTALEVSATPGGTVITPTSTGSTVTGHLASSCTFAITRIDGLSHYLVTADQ